MKLMGWLLVAVFWAAGAAPRRITVPGGMQEWRLLEAPEPRHPAEAVERGITGVVRFTVVIGVRGEIQRAWLVSGHPLLVGAAREALRGYRYRPVRLAGEAVEVVTTVDVVFQMAWPFRVLGMETSRPSRVFRPGFLKEVQCDDGNAKAAAGMARARAMAAQPVAH